MSPEHKKNLLAGRARAQIVKKYLDALPEMQAAGRLGPRELKRRIAAADDAIEEASGVARLEAIQEKKDLTRQLNALEDDTFGELEREFVGIAREYGDAKGIEYESWREFGVAAKVLRQAGIRAD